MKSASKSSFLCFANNSEIETAMSLFDLDCEELTKRMADENLLKTLIFLHENAEKNDFVCKIEKTTLSNVFSSKETAKSEVNMGYLCILILKNVQDTNEDNVSGKVGKLFNGDPSQLKDDVKFLLMINYEIIPVENATHLAEIFNQIRLNIYQTIPVSVTFHEKASIMDSMPFPIFYKKIVAVNFLLNLLLFRYYKTTNYPECDVQMDFPDFSNYIEVFLEKLEKQSAFHKTESTFDEFMNVIGQFQKKIETLPDVEKDEMNNDSDYFVECTGKLSKMAKRNIIPEKNSFMSKTFKNENNENRIIKFLFYDYVKNWPNVLVIPNKQWIGLFRQLYGDDEININSECNPDTIDNFVWVYDESESEEEPFILLNGEKRLFGVIKQKKNKTQDRSLQEHNPSDSTTISKKQDLPTNLMNNSFAKQTETCSRMNEEGFKFLINEESIIKEHRFRLAKKLSKIEEEESQRTESECQNKDEKIRKLEENEKILRKDNQNLKTQIGELENKLKTYQSVVDEAYEENDNLMQQYEQLEARNDENEQTINNLRMEVARLLEVEKDLNDKLMKDSDNKKMEKTISNEKVKTSERLAKLIEDMKQKEPFIKPEQKAAYDHALECLKFMTKKHGSTLNTSELTTDIQQLTKEEFTDAIENFVKTCENSGKLLQKCKEIVEILESE
uniref:Uncharacterized protein n=1 Tax=Panagrolaimus sp. JU765 TaxID=591449 RepID=A0AC34RH12_9BILA